MNSDGGLNSKFFNLVIRLFDIMLDRYSRAVGHAAILRGGHIVD